FCRLRHLRTDASSRQNCSDTNLPGVVMLSKRSRLMKPSAFARSAFSVSTSCMYSGNRPSAGVNSKITAITVLHLPGRRHDTRTMEKACIVVGAGNATGGAVARRLAREGYVACVARRNAGKLQPLVESIRGHGGKAIPFALDARREDQVVEFFARVEREAGPVE